MSLVLTFGQEGSSLRNNPQHLPYIAINDIDCLDFMFGNWILNVIGFVALQHVEGSLRYDPLRLPYMLQPITWTVQVLCPRKDKKKSPFYFRC